MTDIHVTKQGHVLVAADEMSAEVLRKIGQGEYLRATIKRPRNGKFHRKFFALLDTVRHHMDESAEARWPTSERLLWELKLQAGMFDVHVSLGGKETVIPHSISFAQMDADTFDKFYSDCIRIVLKYIIPSISEDDLRASAEQLIADFAA